MFSLLVVALFFLMLLAPCIVALRARRDMAVPGDELLVTPRGQAIALQPEFEPVYLPPNTIEEAEAEMVSTRHAALRAESAALAAEARLATLRARAAADHAALASRAASQAADAVNSASSTGTPQIFVTATSEDSRVVDGSDLPESHPSMDFPRSRIGRRAA